MANILVLGVGPLPFEPGERLHAPGIRTWQIASALASRHHFVTLCVIEFGDFQATGKSQSVQAERQDLGPNISLVKLTYHPEHTASSIRTLHTATRFAAAVSTTDIMNAVTADLELGIPIWLDYNGDPFAEKQLQASLYQHDGSLFPQWQLYLRGLANGDRFSVCSNHQRHAMIGQLAFSGRLTGVNSGEKLVEVLPNCSRIMSERTPKKTTPLKAKQIPATSFLVLWSGGYNTWCDPETLFHGLEAAMNKNESIYFATTGGALDGHDNRSFQIFKDLVDDSAIRDRCVFLGWIPTEEVGAYYEQADLAVFTDRYSVEGELGTRTRLVDWIQYKIPIVCTQLCELTDQLSAENLISTFPIGDADSMAKAILEAASDPEGMHERAERAKVWLDTNLDEIAVLKPLIDWAAAPRFAMDKQAKSGESDTDIPIRSALTQLLIGALPAHGLAAPPPSRNTKASTSEKTPLKSRLKNFFGRKK